MPYDAAFIPGEVVPLPTASQRILDVAFGGDYVDHSRHSILFNPDRGFAFVSAHNIDGETIPDAQYTGRRFKFDPKIQPNSLQVDRDRGYRESETHGFGPNPWDQGHLARRKSLSWGDEADARVAELESDLWSNIVPQHENLHDSAWGPIEDWMLERVQGGGRRACVFTGPIFTEDDPEHTNAADEQPIHIPAGFWKVISVKLDDRMRSAGFLVWQRDYDNPEPLPFAPVLEQVRLTTIEVLTGLTFPALRQFDPLLFETRTRTRRLLDVSTSRAMLRGRLLSGTRSGVGAPFSDLDEALVMQATQPGNSIITNGRDIVL